MRVLGAFGFIGVRHRCGSHNVKQTYTYQPLVPLRSRPTLLACSQQDPHHRQRRAMNALAAVASAEIQCASPAARLVEGDDAAA